MGRFPTICVGFRPVGGLFGGLSRWRKVLVDSQVFWRPVQASVSIAKVWPRLCGCREVGRTTSFSSSPTPSGRCWTMRFSTWTRPTAPKGKPPSAISAMCRGKASTWGYVGGSVSRSEKPQTLA